MLRNDECEVLRRSCKLPPPCCAPHALLPPLCPPHPNAFAMAEAPAPRPQEQQTGRKRAQGGAGRPIGWGGTGGRRAVRSAPNVQHQSRGQAGASLQATYTCQVLWEREGAFAHRSAPLRAPALKVHYGRPARKGAGHSRCHGDAGSRCSGGASRLHPAPRPRPCVTCCWGDTRPQCCLQCAPSARSAPHAGGCALGCPEGA